MSMSYTDLITDLTEFVRDTLSPLKVVGENERHKPELGTPYAQCYLLPATTTRDTLGEQGQFKYIGLLQVSIYLPAQSGQAGNSYIDKLVEAVQTQPTRDIGVTAVHLRQVTRIPGQVNGDWYHLPCRIEYWAYA